MKRLIAIFLLILLAACTGTSEVEEAASVPEAPPVQVTKTSAPELPATAAATAIVLSETDIPQPATAIPTVEEDSAETAEPPTITPPPMPTEAPVVQVISGQTEDGVFFLGDLNAPLTVIDYSDFL